MKRLDTRLPEVVLLEPDVFEDERGFFLELWRAERAAELGVPEAFVQENHSRSRRGVLRGLHYQITRPQGKLVMVTNGVVFDVAVDIRLGSPTYGEWVGVTLSDKNHRLIYIPPGFAHGFSVVSEQADVIYKCNNYYDRDGERGVRWDDPCLGIEWPVLDPVLSKKDAALPRLDALAEDDLPKWKRPKDGGA